MMKEIKNNKFSLNYLRIIMLIVWWCISISSQPVKNEISLRIFPDLIKENASKEFVYLSITNFTSDTLITINDIFIEGIIDSASLYPMSNKFTPNVLFFASDSFPLAFIDGWFNVEFNRMPQFNVIRPMSQTIFEVDISKYSELMNRHSWKTFGLVTYANKERLDSLINSDLPNYLIEYKRSLIYEDVNLVRAELTDSLKNYYSENSNSTSGDLNLIKTVFKKRIRSKDL